MIQINIFIEHAGQYVTYILYIIIIHMASKFQIGII